MTRGGRAGRSWRVARRTRAIAAAALAAAALPGRADTSDAWRDAGRAAVAQVRAQREAGGRAKNVILFLGDGMGVSTVTAARILDGQLRGGSGEENLLAFERLPHLALTKTYNTDQQVADSAGTMTAIVTGVKTRAGVLSMGPEGARGDHRAGSLHRLPTLFEQAETRGLSTGVVSTARLTHATPAACYAHAPDRSWENDALLDEEARADGFPDLARQLVEFAAGDGLEVALGGGRVNFLPQGAADPEYPDERGARRDGRDLVEAWRGRWPRAAVVWNAKQLAALDLARTDHLLGLFEPSHMQFEALRARDRGGEPSLAEMTDAALDVLARNPRGYVLMVEGGRIDHGHHAGSAYLALHDTLAFSEAVARALDRIDLADTLVVVTADHSHVLTIAGYPARGNPILGLVHPAASGVGGDAEGPAAQPLHDLTGRPYTTLGYANGPGHLVGTDAQPAGPKHFPHQPRRAEAWPAGRPDLSALDTEAPTYLQESAIPLEGETHGGEDVAVYAGGPGASLFQGVQEQSYVYHAIVASLGWDRPARRGFWQRWFGDAPDGGDRNVE